MGEHSSPGIPDSIKPSPPASAGTSRRRFLHSAAALAAGMAGLPRAAVAQQPTAPVVVGGCAWVYAIEQPNHDIVPVLEEVFADAAYAGMGGVEVLQTTLRSDVGFARLAALCAKYQVPLIGSSFVGAMWDRRQHGEILREAELVIGRLGKLGGKRLGVTVGAPAGLRPKSPQQLDDQAQLLRQLMAIAQPAGVVVDLHNHTYEVQDGQRDLHETLARVPEIKLGPDLGWLHRAHIDPLAFLRQHAQRLVFMHLRDDNAAGTCWAEVMGEGVMDYAGVGKLLHDINFAGYLVVELAHEKGARLARPVRESLKISREYVRTVMKY